MNCGFFLVSFLHDLVRDMTKDVSKDGKEHIEYVPTQIVTEYFKYIFNKNRKRRIEGLVYPSSKEKSSNATVIFWDNRECLDNLELIGIEDEELYTTIPFLMRNTHSGSALLRTIRLIRSEIENE